MSDQKEQQTAPTKEPKIVLPDYLRNPEAQAAMSAMMSSAIKEIFASIQPLLQSVALTDEKLQKIAHPGPSPETAAREKREKQLMMEEQAENRRNREAVQKSCPHRYPSGALAISCVHNYPDRQPRGVCQICMLVITPREWRIGPPTLDGKNPRGVAYIAEPHPLYSLVLEKENLAGA